MADYFVYIWRNVANDSLRYGWSYVGKHKGAVDDGYVSSSKNELFWEDYNKGYLLREILFDSLTAEEAARLEQEEIQKLFFSEQKYNLGKYNIDSGHLQVIFDDEIRKKVSLPGEQNGMWGRTHSIEARYAQYAKKTKYPVMTMPEWIIFTEHNADAISQGKHKKSLTTYLRELGYLSNSASVKPKVSVEEVKSRERAKAAEQRIKQREKDLQQWLLTEHFCKCCGKRLFVKYGKGEFCDNSCLARYYALRRSPETQQKINASIKERYSVPENNPNYGKKASPETLQKMSSGIKAAYAEGKCQSSRFKGKTHTVEEREKISGSLRRVWEVKKSGRQDS